MAATLNPHFYAIVDMGSNGIRFSITDMSPPTARILPTLYQDRVGISLYKAQYSTIGAKTAIPPSIVEEVVNSLRKFKIICQDFGVAPDNVRVVATEATREAHNSLQFRSEIHMNTGWEVELLAKEEEGRLGALGIASSFYQVEGLVMDLGGGSTQLTWIIMKDGHFQTSEKGSISLPYGAAALTRRLADAGRNEHLREGLRVEIQNTVRRAYEDLQVPAKIEKRAEQAVGFPLYLSGGGFRGWGYILMSDDRVKPYPIPIINGYRVGRDDFQDIESIQQVAREHRIFGVSKERVDQVPAVAFLIGTLTAVLPMIHEVRFCQGGIREGILYSSLPEHTRALHSLTVATLPYAPSMANEIQHILQRALPKFDNERDLFRNTSKKDLFNAVANLFYYHQPLTKDTRAAAALRSTTTGILAGVHGIDHQDRALLALILCERWGGVVGPLDDVFLDQLQSLVGNEQLWWAKYIGRVADLVGVIHPAGRFSGSAPRISLNSCWKDSGSIYLKITVGTDPTLSGTSLMKCVKRIEKVGKEKEWRNLAGKDGLALSIKTEIIRI